MVAIVIPPVVGVYVITMRYTHKFYVTYCNILKYSYIIYYFCNSDGKTG